MDICEKGLHILKLHIYLRPWTINFKNSRDALANARTTQKARCDETGLGLGPLIAASSRKYVLLAIRSAA